MRPPPPPTTAAAAPHSQPQQQHHPRQKVHREIKVPREAVGFVIGRHGETVRNMSYRSGAQIAVDEKHKDPRARFGVFNVDGHPENVDAAVALIREKVQAVLHTPFPNPHTAVHDALVFSPTSPPPPDPQGPGPGPVLRTSPSAPVPTAGSPVGTSAPPNPGSAAGGGPPTTPPAHAASATTSPSRVGALAGAGASALPGYPLGGAAAAPPPLEMWIPAGRVGMVIGHYGQTINGMQERSGATIVVHNKRTIEDGSKLLTISGPDKNRQIAKGLVQNVLNRELRAQRAAAYDAHRARQAQPEPSRAAPEPAPAPVAAPLQHQPHQPRVPHQQAPQPHLQLHHHPHPAAAAPPAFRHQGGMPAAHRAARERPPDTAQISPRAAGLGEQSVRGGPGWEQSSGAHGGGAPESLPSGGVQPTGGAGPAGAPQHMFGQGQVAAAGAVPFGTRVPYDPMHFAAGQAGRAGLYAPPFSTTKAVRVPTICVGIVIGKGGETIHDLQTRSGAYIKVTPDREADERETERLIYISGPPHAIELAHNLLNDIVNEGLGRSYRDGVDPARAQSDPAHPHERTPPGTAAPADYDGSSNTPELPSSGSGAAAPADTPGEGDTREGLPDAAPPPPFDGDVTVVPQPVTGYPSTSISLLMQVPNAKVGVIIGKRGQTIRDLQQRSGARIVISKKMDTSQKHCPRDVRITGPPAFAHRARALILDKIRGGSASASLESSPALRQAGVPEPGPHVLRLPPAQFGVSQPHTPGAGSGSASGGGVVPGSPVFAGFQQGPYLAVDPRLEAAAGFAGTAEMHALRGRFAQTYHQQQQQQQQMHAAALHQQALQHALHQQAFNQHALHQHALQQQQQHHQHHPHHQGHPQMHAHTAMGMQPFAGPFPMHAGSFAHGHPAPPSPPFAPHFAGVGGGDEHAVPPPEALIPARVLEPAYQHDEVAEIAAQAATLRIAPQQHVFPQLWHPHPQHPQQQQLQQLQHQQLQHQQLQHQHLRAQHVSPIPRVQSAPAVAAPGAAHGEDRQLGVATAAEPGTAGQDTGTPPQDVGGVPEPGEGREVETANGNGSVTVDKGAQ